MDEPRPAATDPPWHATGLPETERRLATDLVRGLDPAEAAARLARDGPNAMPEPPREPHARTFLRQFANVLVGALIAAAVLAAAMGERAEAAAIAAILVLNAGLGYLQERRAGDALAGLRRLSVPAARVRRGGVETIVPAPALVAGDVVVVEAGEGVPADLRLVRTSGLRTVEAALTGESDAVGKDASASVPAGAALAERRTAAYLGTTVAAGAAEGVVVATGPATELGRIVRLVAATQPEPTPLEARLAALGRRLVAACGIAVAVVFVVGLVRDVPWLEMLLTALSLAVAAVPEGLPAVVTIALALGVTRMARRNAIVRRLASVETLGCTTVICADKTGTLTVGEMSVRAVHAGGAETDLGEPRARPRGDPVRETLRAAAACSSARLVARPDGRTQVAGDPMEGALLLAAEAAGVSAADLDVEEPVAAVHPFDADRKRMAVVRRAGAGHAAYVKGAPESVLPLCTDATSADADAADSMAARGLRVLAVAWKRSGERPEEDLSLLGLVGMRDPPRPTAPSAVARCRSAGIRPVMITGDHSRTALAVAREIGIAATEDAVVSGPEVEAMDDAALAARAATASVFARTSPEQKLRIVRALRSRGEVVAMTGDGVNDAPALRGADIGVALGRKGTDAARNAAAMVVTDDDFGTIVAAVEEGRVVFDNVRKSLAYLLPGNLGEILVMTVAVTAGSPLPLAPLQLLWINFVTDGLPALALAADPADPACLGRPPRPRDRPIADGPFVRAVLTNAALNAAVALGAFAWALAAGAPVERARTYVFALLVFSAAFRCFVVRSTDRTAFEVGFGTNRRLAAVAAATVGLQLLIHHGGFLRGILGTSELTWPESLALLLLAAVPATVVEASKLLRRR